MLRVYECITQQHDWPLLIVAALLCTLGAFTALSLAARAQTSTGAVQASWLAATAVVAGTGIWATHFVAMIAFKPELPMSFDLALTLLSVAIAVAVTGLGFALPIHFLRDHRFGRLAGGIVFGIGIFAMHYTGMSAVTIMATIDYDPAYVAASLAIGVTLSAFAFSIGFSNSELRVRLAVASLLALAICGLHFTGMAAVSFAYNPFAWVAEKTVDDQWLAIGIAISMLFIIGGGLGGSFADQRIATVSAREAMRLRALVSELEETKRHLESTSGQLMTALDAAAAGSQAKSRFLAIMSHELRTPLNAILGFAELLRAGGGGPLSEDQCEYIDNIHEAGAQLLGIVNDVLDLTMLSAGQVELKEKEVDLRETVESVLSVLEPHAARKRISIGKDFGRNLPRILADPLRLRQVVLNLLSNAVKFTPEDGDVQVAIGRDKDGVVLSVADNGIGIAREKLSQILRPFGQIDVRLERRYEGIGLGLPIAKRLVELHHGQLEVESDEGAGTTATVRLPFSRIAQAAESAA
ncbi:MAG: MHYT domain-containing protein [Kiloniellales bacterium]